MATSNEAISELESFLVERGLTCIRREVPQEAMGYQLMEYAGSDIRVRLVWEKGLWDFRLGDPELASDAWYDIRLFTYLLRGAPQPEISFEKQVEYAKTHWQEIVDTLTPSRRIHTRVRLDAAKMERARKIYMIWPTAVRDLELFLKSTGLVCTYRKEARFLYDSMTVRYSNSGIAVQIDSQNGWHIEFANVARDPNRWYSLASIRKLIQWPNDRKLSYVEMFDFIRTNWSNVLDMFAQTKCEETHQRLCEIEQAAAI